MTVPGPVTPYRAMGWNMMLGAPVDGTRILALLAGVPTPVYYCEYDQTYRVIPGGKSWKPSAWTFFVFSPVGGLQR